MDIDSHVCKFSVCSCATYLIDTCTVYFQTSMEQITLTQLMTPCLKCSWWKKIFSANMTGTHIIYKHGPKPYSSKLSGSFTV